MTFHPRADVAEDTSFLLSFGVSPAHITHRLDMTPEAIAQALYREGEKRSARGFWAEARRAAKTRPRPAHRPARVLTFTTDTGPLDLTQCVCGRLFDKTGMTRHLKGGAS